MFCRRCVCVWLASVNNHARPRHYFVIKSALFLQQLVCEKNNWTSFKRPSYFITVEKKILEQCAVFNYSNSGLSSRRHIVSRPIKNAFFIKIGLLAPTIDFQGHFFSHHIKVVFWTFCVFRTDLRCFIQI